MLSQKCADFCDSKHEWLPSEKASVLRDARKEGVHWGAYYQTTYGDACLCENSKAVLPVSPFRDAGAIRVFSKDPF